MEELGIPALTTKQIEILCQKAEQAAKKHILSKISFKLVETLNIIVEANGEKPITVNIELDLKLSPKAQDINPEIIAKEAIKEALKTSEEYLRKIK